MVQMMKLRLSLWSAPLEWPNLKLVHDRSGSLRDDGFHGRCLCRYSEGSVEIRGRIGFTERERCLYGRYLKILYAYMHFGWLEEALEVREKNQVRTPLYLMILGST